MCRHVVALCPGRFRPASVCPRSFSLVYHLSTVTRLSKGSAFSLSLPSFFLCSSNSSRILSYCTIMTKNRKRRACEGGYLSPKSLCTSGVRPWHLAWPLVRQLQLFCEHASRLILTKWLAASLHAVCLSAMLFWQFGIVLRLSRMQFVRTSD